MVGFVAISPWLCFALGLLVLGEATALFLGMTIFAPKGHEWKVLKNYFFEFIDVVSGIAVMFFSIFKKEVYSSPWLYVLLGIITVSHTYREFEFFFGKPATKFCGNIPLFIFNNIKLLGSIACIGIGLYLVFLG